MKSAAVQLFVLALAPAALGQSAQTNVTVESSASAESLAAKIHAEIRDALGASDAAGEARGSRLADYAALPAGDPQRHESPRDAARRIVAELPAQLVAPDRTAAWLLAASRQLESALAGRPAADRAGELQAAVHLARFHGLRLIAAVRYNLFRRQLSLSELYAAVRQERLALEAWRELVRLPGQGHRTAARRTELSRLEENLLDLEAQCCPPLPEVIAGAVWNPRPE
jgi:hypothetical protein